MYLRKITSKKIKSGAPRSKNVLKSDSFNHALAAAKLSSFHKGHNIRIFQVKEHCSYADYFVVVTATSTKHAQSLAHHLGQKKVLSIEGLEKSNWVVIDLGEIVVHVFLEETRSHYHFDKIWGHVPNEPYIEKTLSALKA